LLSSIKQNKSDNVAVHTSDHKFINQQKQGVTLTGRNTTGSPHAAPWWVTLHMRVLKTTMTDDSNHYLSGLPTLCVGGPLIKQYKK